MFLKFLKNGNFLQVLKFVAVSAVAGGTQWLIYFLFEHFGATHVLLQVGYAISVTCGCIISFLINRKVTFQHKGSYWRFFAHAAFYAIMIGWLTPLLGFLVKKGLNAYLANLINGAIMMICEFFFLKLILFRKKNIKEHSLTNAADESKKIADINDGDFEE